MKKIILLVVVVVLIVGGLFAFKNITKKTATIDQSSTPKTAAMATESPSTMVLKQGKFMDADGFHKGSGTAQVIKTDQGNVLKFGSDFTVINGPELFVYFSKTADEKPKGSW